MPRLSALLTAAIAVLLAVPAAAEPTSVTVRALADDAKFIGTTLGGAHIVIRDAATGAILAEGVTTGGTGDTEALMVAPRERHARIAEGDAAAFETVIDIDEPTLLRFEASGPLDHPSANMQAMQTRLVFPGRPPHGPDGIVLTLSGLIVEMAAPSSFGTGFSAGEEVPIRVQVAHLCGCPLTPDGLWDANGYEIGFIVTRGEREVASGTLDYAGMASHFAGGFTPAESGVYSLTVTAYHPQTGNSGIGTRTIRVR